MGGGGGGGYTGILRFLNCGGGGGGGGVMAAPPPRPPLEQIDYLGGVQSGIAVPVPHRCQCVKFKLLLSIILNVTCTICKHSTDAYPPLVTICHSALTSKNPQLYILTFTTMVAYVLIDAHPLLVGWGEADMQSLLRKCCLL